MRSGSFSFWRTPAGSNGRGLNDRTGLECRPAAAEHDHADADGKPHACSVPLAGRVRVETADSVGGQLADHVSHHLNGADHRGAHSHLMSSRSPESSASSPRFRPFRAPPGQWYRTCAAPAPARDPRCRAIWSGGGPEWRRAARGLPRAHSLPSLPVAEFRRIRL